MEAYTIVPSLRKVKEKASRFSAGMVRRCLHDLCSACSRNILIGSTPH